MIRTSPCRLIGAVIPLLALLVMGCDSAGDPPPLNPQTPLVAGLSVSPRAALVDTLAVVDDAVVVPLTIEVTAQPGDAPIQRVAYAIQWQFSCQPGAVEASGELLPAGDGRFAAAPELVVPPGRRGTYRVAAWAVDASGLPGNEVVHSFDLGGTNLGPPVIESVQGPAQVRPPATLRFVVTVSDPDGIDHIARAEVETPGAGTFPLAHTDASGNNVACNGIYSVSFSVPRGVPPGQVPFTFRAFDREGAASDTVPFTLEIIP